MRGRSRTWPAVAAILALVAVAGGGAWLASRGAGGSAPASAASAVPSPSASPAPNADRLTLDLQRVEGKRVSGSRVRKRRLLPAAETVRRVMTQMYTTGFVDPDAWQGGRFPTLEDLFTIRTRSRVRRDLDELSLGPIARRVDEVRPGASTIGVRFLVGSRPLVAVAAVKFRGTAIADGTTLPILHAGSYTLRRLGGRWQIASYEVRSRVPTIHDLNAKVREAAGSPGLASTGTSFILVIGSDARPGESPKARAAIRCTSSA